MTNKAINLMVNATIDSLKNLIKKLPKFFAIFGLALGSTTAIQQSARAISIANTLTALAADANGDTNANDTITTGMQYNVAGGNANFNSASTEIAITSITSTAADTAMDIAGAGGVKVTGNLTAVIKDLIVTIDSASKFELVGNSTDSATENMGFILEGSTLTFSGTSAQNIDMNIDSDNGNDGIISLTGAGKKTFDDAIGSSSELGSMTAAASTDADFEDAVDIKIVTVNGTALEFNGALGVNTMNINTTVDINAATTNEAATNEAALILNATGAILNLNATGDVAQDVIITATTTNFGAINIFDETEDAAGGITTLSADSLIGANAKRIGTINIGKADGTKAGNIVGVDGAAIFARDINITGGNHAAEDSSISAMENVTATAITLSATGAADAVFKTLTAAVTVTGTVDSASGTDGLGFTLIDADVATTFVNNVGATVAIEKMDIAAKVDLDGAVNQIEAVNFSADQELEFAQTGNQSLTGVITTTTTEHGTVENGNTAGTLTFSGTIGTAALRIKEIALLDNTDTTFESAIVALTLDIDTAAVDDVTTFTIGNIIGDKDATAGALTVAGGTFVLDTAAVGGTTIFDTKETDNADGGVELRALVVQPSANFTNGTMTFIDGATAASIDAADVGGISITDNIMTDYTVNITAGVADVTIVASAKSDASVAKSLGVTNNQARAAANILEAAIGGDTTLMNTLNESITGLNSGVIKTTADLAVQAAPQTDTIGGSSVATRAMTGTVQGIVSNRMASLRSGDAFVTGMSAGNGMSANSGFIQAFGSEAEQKNTSNQGATVFGFDSETAGLAVGFDGMTESGSTIGLSASYSTTDVDGKGTGKSKNSIDSYTVSVYADKATDVGYIEGSLTYGINDNTASRLVNVAGLNRAYSANYDSNQVSLKVGGGVPQEVMDGAFITPFMNATATTINTDAYTEKSTVVGDALRLKVVQDDINSLVGSLGVKAHMVTDNGTPMISFAVNNEFGDSEIASQNTYQGGGTKFKTTTEIEELSATLGLGFSFGNDVTSLNINYEANATEDDYVSQYGSVKIVAKF